jgi:hypothetical protein
MKAVAALVCCLFAISILSLSRSAPAQAQREDFSAIGQMPPIAGSAMVGAGATVEVTIYIDSYSSDDEARMMAGKFAKGAHQALRTALDKATLKGRIAVAGRNGYYELKLLRSTPTPNGRRIFAVGMRSITFFDAYYPGRSYLDEFGILQLDLTKTNGVEAGSGALMHAAKIKSLSADSIVLDNHGVEPVRLTGVQKSTP